MTSPVWPGIGGRGKEATRDMINEFIDDYLYYYYSYYSYDFYTQGYIF